MSVLWPVLNCDLFVINFVNGFRKCNIAGIGYLNMGSFSNAFLVDEFMIYDRIYMPYCFGHENIYYDGLL